MSSHPVADYLGEEANPCVTATSFQVVVKSDKVSSQDLSPLVQTKPQLSHGLFIKLVLQIFPSSLALLWTLQHLNVPFELKCPGLDTGLKAWPCQC